MKTLYTLNSIVVATTLAASALAEEYLTNVFSCPGTNGQKIVNNITNDIPDLELTVEDDKLVEEDYLIEKERVILSSDLELTSEKLTSEEKYNLRKKHEIEHPLIMDIFRQTLPFVKTGQTQIRYLNTNSPNWTILYNKTDDPAQKQNIQSLTENIISKLGIRAYVFSNGEGLHKIGNNITIKPLPENGTLPIEGDNFVIFKYINPIKNLQRKSFNLNN